MAGNKVLAKTLTCCGSLIISSRNLIQELAADSRGIYRAANNCDYALASMPLTSPLTSKPIDLAVPAIDNAAASSL